MASTDALRTEPAATDVVEIHTDGGCSGNPGPGGWGAVLRWRDHERELSGHEPATTNNRMEMMAVICGLRVLRLPLTLDLYSDSQYVLKGLSQWLPGWKRRGWRTAGGGAVKNQDLWVELDQLLARHTVRTHWVRGHSGHPENERCDQLAVAAARRFRR